MIRRPPRSTLSSSSAASDVYKRQLRIDVVKKVMAIMTGYCLSKLVVSLLNDSVHGDVLPYVIYTSGAAVVFALYLTYAKPVMAGETFVKHAIQLGVAMAPVIMGWAFRDTIIAYYRDELLNSDGTGKFPKGTNWMVQLGVALLWLFVVAGVAFLRCVRKETLSFDKKGNFFSHFKLTFLYTPLSIGWALNKSFQTLYLQRIDTHDTWNAFCLYTGSSFVFSAITAAIVRLLMRFSDDLEATVIASKKHQKAIKGMAKEALEHGTAFTKAEFVARQAKEDCFDELDVDHDGLVTSDELQKAKKIELATEETLEQTSKLGIQMLRFMNNSLGFVFAWTWNYVITYFWFVAIFNCTSDPNKIVGTNLCGPAPAFMLASILTVLMWVVIPNFTVTLKDSSQSQYMIRLTIQMATLTKSSMGVIVGWAWTNYIGAQLEKWSQGKLDKTMLYFLATLAVASGACVLFHFYKVYEATLHAALIVVQEERIGAMKQRKAERINSKRQRMELSLSAYRPRDQQQPQPAASQVQAKSDDNEPRQVETIPLPRAVKKLQAAEQGDHVTNL
eukprot:TRINITY_DN10661_c0_g2_i1.p1 TRINITY_DN10661_c0_g2~~TRINITY_DN10661_c0_g2_i1.p1  ORF type:complete len:560 (+),score=148.96 TRINITY_DN10661_c0_g2_i1:71-1750(+)